jgi:hypothetical protein
VFGKIGNDGVEIGFESRIFWAELQDARIVDDVFQFVLFAGVEDRLVWAPSRTRQHGVIEIAFRHFGVALVEVLGERRPAPIAEDEIVSLGD